MFKVIKIEVKIVFVKILFFPNVENKLKNVSKKKKKKEKKCAWRKFNGI